MKKILALRYWFELAPGRPDIGFWRWVLYGSIAIIIIGIAAIVMMRKNANDGIRRRFWSKIVAWGLTTGCVSLVLLFFRYQDAYFLSMRILIAAWLVFAAVWACFIAKFRFINMPKKLRARQELESFNKYLPQKKA